MKNTGQKLILISFVLALIATIAVFLYLQSLKNPTTAAKKTTILVAAEAIPPRTLIDKKMVKEMEITDNTMFKDYISDSSKIVGQYTKETILKDEGFVKEKLISGTENELSLKIEKNYRAVSINVTGDTGVSRLIKAGDFVDIVVYLAEKKDGVKVIRPDTAKVFLQNIEVLAVDQELDRSQKETEKAADKEKALTTFLVTIAVSTSDLEKIVLAEDIGTIKLALRPLKDDSINNTDGTTDAELTVDDTNKAAGTNPESNPVSGSKDAKKYTSYTVQRADSLKKISKSFYGDPEKYVIIKEANNLQDENIIITGEVLRIPILQ